MKDKDMRSPAALSAFVKGDIENALVASTPGGIEAQEKRGQQSLVQSTDMPFDLHPNKAAFESIGFVFGGKIDDVFQEAKLPSGWTREASNHSMWSHIKDQHGRTRVAVFYKAAFYDRNASARLERRYEPHSIYPDDKGSPIEIGVSDSGKMIWKAGEAQRTYDRAERARLDTAVESYLKEHHPNWLNPLAYWDDAE